jgi:hypothetical protein
VDHGRRIAESWVAIYGQQPHFEELRGDFPLIFQALMDTVLPVLKGKSVRELIPYKEADDKRIRYAVDFMLTGMNRPSKLEPRHCVSAARLAVSQASLTGTLSDGALSQLNQRTMGLVKANAPPGLRGAGVTTAHKKFIASFADKWNPGMD